MATTYKTFLNNDITSTRTLLHEQIPITGSLASGTYGTFGSEENVKNYSHGMFQSVYDYPYLSSSANHIFDLTFGLHDDSALSSSTAIQIDKKINLYNQMAQVLMGHDHTGSIQKFDQDGDLLAGGTKLNEVVFFNFARLLHKDEIKKGTFSMSLGATTAFATANNSLLNITDAGAANDYRVNSPAGEYGILSMSSGEATGSPLNGYAGLVFYQAGVAVLTASVFMGAPTGAIAADAIMTDTGQAGGGDMVECLTGSTIEQLSDAVRHRLYNIEFQNTTELNSTIYFCRAHHNEFNYSSNPTYLSASKIQVKNNTLDQPVAYITTVGLYSADSELLAVAKLSEPLKKTPSNEITIKTRIDF